MDWMADFEGLILSCCVPRLCAISPSHHLRSESAHKNTRTTSVERSTVHTNAYNANRTTYRYAKQITWVPAQSIQYGDGDKDENML